ncbi:MAG: response regulator transcription factor [Thermoguttaceae bacterium]
MSEHSPPRQGRALVADANLHMLKGVHTLLESLFDTTVMVSDERSLLETMETCRQDICVVDLLFPVTAEVNAILLIRRRCPALPVVVLSLYDEPSVAQEALAQGAMAFVLKRAALVDLVPAVEAIRRGETYISPFARSPPRGLHECGGEAGPGDSLEDHRPSGATN